MLENPIFIFVNILKIANTVISSSYNNYVKNSTNQIKYLRMQPETSTYIFLICKFLHVHNYIYYYIAVFLYDVSTVISNLTNAKTAFILCS